MFDRSTGGAHDRRRRAPFARPGARNIGQTQRGSGLACETFNTSVGIVTP
jgi:hypothetical protein